MQVFVRKVFHIMLYHLLMSSEFALKLQSTAVVISNMCEIAFLTICALPDIGNTIYVCYYVRINMT